MSHLPAFIRLEARLNETPEKEPEEARKLDLQGILDGVEKRLIELALKRAGGNRSKAAESLSIWRARLLRRMEALGIVEE